jgi:cysteine desulfuration protein SufE
MHPKTLEVLEDFSLVPDSEKLNLLLEYSEKLPEAPVRFGENPELFERVTECQSPVFIAVEGTQQKVNLFFSAPREAPTTRGFASVLFQALDGLSVEEIRSLPDSFVDGLGLTKLVSPLRMRGMAGMLARIKRRSGELI